MNQKLAATAAILLLLPAATTVLLTRMPAFLPAFLPASDLHAYLPDGLTWLNEVLTPPPPAAVGHGRARKSSRTGSCGDCRSVLWEPGLRGQYSGKFILSRNLGVATWLNVVLTPPPPRQQYATEEPGKVQGRDHVGIVEGSCG